MRADAQRPAPPALSQTERIAQAVLALRFEDIPPEVVAWAKTLLTDLLLVAAAGTQAPGSAALRQAVPASAGRSRVWFLDTPPQAAQDAAFLNTLHAAALDYDSLNGAVHADLVTLPAAWAVAEQVGADGRALLTAFIASTELVSRWSRAANGPSLGWSGTALYGGLGAALASARLLGLPATAMRHALGLAASQAAGTQQANLEQVLSKRLQPALAVRQGVFAAHLAAAGASSPAQALEGRFGLRALTQPGDDATVLQSLWQDWQILDTSLKSYPVCACSHAALEALQTLRQQYDLQAADVSHLRAVISPFMARLVGSPFQRTGDAQVTAQFSLRYQLACLLVRGQLTLDEIAPDALDDAAILALIPSMDVVVDPAQTGELGPATVTVTRHDGQRLSQHCPLPPGAPTQPLSPARWRAKLADCARYAHAVLSQDGLDTLHARIATLEHATRLDTLLPTARA